MNHRRSLVDASYTPLWSDLCDDSTVASWTAAGDAVLVTAANYGGTVFPRSGTKFFRVGTTGTGAWSITKTVALDLSGGGILRAMAYQENNTNMVGQYITFTDSAGGTLTLNLYGTAAACGGIGWNVLSMPIPPAAYATATYWPVPPTAYYGWRTSVQAFDPAHVVSVTFGSTGGVNDRYLCLDEIGVYPTATKAALAFTIDDHYAAATLAIAAILEEYGWRGTFATIGNTVSNSTKIAETDALYAKGHCFNNHGYASFFWTSGSGASDEKRIADMTAGRDFLDHQGWTRGSRIFTPPGGEIPDGWYTLALMASDFTIVANPRNLEQLENGTPTVKMPAGFFWGNMGSPLPNPLLWGSGYLDRSWLYAPSGFLTADRLNYVVACKALGVVGMHNLTGDGGELTEATFRTFLDAVAAHEAAGNLEVLTIDEIIYGQLPAASDVVSGVDRGDGTLGTDPRGGGMLIIGD